MDKYKIELSAEAGQDFENIVRYIKNKLLEPGIARNYANFMEKQIKTLEYLPERYAIIDRKSVRHYNLRKLVIKNYIAFYRVNADEKIVNIERILYGGMDWQSIL